jgi:hypothetical protein
MPTSDISLSCAEMLPDPSIPNKCTHHGIDIPTTPVFRPARAECEIHHRANTDGCYRYDALMVQEMILD